MIATRHIRAMLAAAAELAEQAESGHFGEDKAPAALERAANLATHAGEELRDEMLRARDGWPVI